MLPRLFTFACALVGLATAAPSGEELFRSLIQPTLKQQCFGCHGEANTFAKLDLTSREAAASGGEHGPAIVSGDPDSSLLLKAIEQTGELKMPPGGEEKKLPPRIRQAFREWISAGAPYAAGPLSDKQASDKQAAGKWDYAEEDLWAFRPLAKVVPPVIAPTSTALTTHGAGAGLVRTPVDAFLLATLAEKSLQPGPRADKPALIRRVTFDLTGLPPTPREVQSFLADSSDAAYKNLVERLLASPRYGERWGRHWLDVTRYADTSGYSNDFERPNAWRYRDYVIRSLNNDKPYDRFILEQIAGDELFPGDPEAIIATGFLRTGPWEHTGMAVAAVTRQLFLDDVTHHVGQSFLGLTLGCARCHDHKFDPIPTKDYYRLQAVFATTAFARRPLPFQAYESTDDFEAGRERYAAILSDLERRQKELHDRARIRLAAERGKEFAASASSGVLQRYLEGNEAEALKLLRKQRTIHKESALRFEPLATAVSSGLVDKWNDITSGANSYLKAADYKNAETHVLAGGDLQALGEKVTPGVLEAVERYSGLAPPEIPSTVGGRRAALAKWIADPGNPLTARVMVNRIWQYHFGRGLAANANNFGKTGKKPTHPELLDWLANFFIEQGWSVKAVHRVILYSEAYQRSAQHQDLEELQRKDPENLYLARFSPRRLEAEELRDAMLAVAGELGGSRGGPGTYPQINADVARQPRHAQGSLRPLYQAEPNRRRRNRRSIYSFQQRSLIDPMIDVFNGANPDLTCESRESSTVPTQAFTLLNSEQSHEMALIMAQRIEKEASSLEGRIDRAFQLAYGRAPTQEEQQSTQRHLEKMQQHHAANRANPRTEPPAVVGMITSELTGEKFEFVQPRIEQDYEHNPHPSEVSPQTRALADLALALFNSNEFVYLY